MSPLVSVIIPCFNQGQYLARAIDSVLEQNYARYEIIVIDDGSTDHTPEICRKYEGMIDTVRQPNHGLAAARNAGLRRCEGELILFLDSDDWISSDYLEFQVAALEKFPDADVALSDVAAVEEGVAASLDISQCDYPATPTVPLERLMLQPPPFVHSALFRRNLVDEIGYLDPALRSSEDWDFWLRAAISGRKFVRSGGGLAVYCRTPGSLTSNTKQIHRTRLRVARKLRQASQLRSPRGRQLLKDRLCRHRLDYWEWVLSCHATLHPIELAKFAILLGQISCIDLGFVPFLVSQKPWKRALTHHSIDRGAKA